MVAWAMGVLNAERRFASSGCSADFIKHWHHRGSFRNFSMVGRTDDWYRNWCSAGRNPANIDPNSLAEKSWTILYAAKFSL